MPCARLIERLNSENVTSQIAAQFVPIKVDTSSSDWTELDRQYRPEGDTIPIVLILRADDEKIYGKSGSLTGDQLPSLLRESLGSAGTMLNQRQLNDASQALDALESALAADDWTAISKALRLAKRVGTLGGIGSFAQAPLKLDAMVGELGKTSIERLQTIQKEVESSLENETELKNATKKFMLADQQLSKIASLNPEISKMLKAIQRMGGVKSMVAAIEASGESLQVAETSSSTDTGSADSTDLREWRSSNGRFSIQAKLLTMKDGVARLQKANGEIVEVTVARLCQPDREFLESRQN